MLEIKNLTCGYDEKIVLQGIDLKANAGEFIGVIGPNGSGKTTLIRAISRLVRPRAGSIFLAGKNIWQMSFNELAKTIAVVSQSLETGSLSVEELVILGRLPYFRRFQFLETRQDVEAAERCMALTGIIRLKDKPIYTISFGERQLAFISRALAQEPKLLLLDEPTSHLDIAHQVQVLDLLSKLNKELSLTIIMVLHDLNLAAEYCRRLVLIHEGRIHKTGTPSEVLTYQTIEDVYKTVVLVEKNPVSSKPCVLLVSEEERNRKRR